MVNKCVATYLTGHLAGAVAAVRLLESLEDVYEKLQPRLSALSVDIEADRICRPSWQGWMSAKAESAKSAAGLPSRLPRSRCASTTVPMSPCACLRVWNSCHWASQAN